MSTRLLAFVLLLLSLSFAPAHAQTTTTLCSDPADADCIDPRWGVIEPGLTDDSVKTGTTPSTAVNVLSARIMPASTARASIAPKAVIDGSDMFASETEALTKAMRAVRFDARGRIVEGAAELKTAVAAVRRAAAGSRYALTLYVKVTSEGVKQDAVVRRKLDAVNSILGSKPAATKQTG